MSIVSSTKEFLRCPKLSFDRSFSERGTRQLIWLLVAVVTVFVLLYFISMFFPFEEIQEDEQVMGRFLRLVTLFIDPGARHRGGGMRNDGDDRNVYIRLDQYA